MKNNLHFFVILALVFNCVSSRASTPGDPLISDYLVSVKNEILRNWITSKKVPGLAVVGFIVTRDGAIKDANIIRSCGAPQIDDECLESVYAASPLIKSMPPSGYDQLSIEMNFDPANKSRKISTKIDSFRQRHNVGFAGCVFHAIPISVIDRYPTLFTMSELDSDENLRVGSLDKLRAIYASWSDFFKAHAKATKNQIIRERARLATFK